MGNANPLPCFMHVISLTRAIAALLQGGMQPMNAAQQSQHMVLNVTDLMAPPQHSAPQQYHASHQQYHQPSYQQQHQQHQQHQQQHYQPPPPPPPGYMRFAPAQLGPPQWAPPRPGPPFPSISGDSHHRPAVSRQPTHPPAAAAAQQSPEWHPDRSPTAAPATEWLAAADRSPMERPAGTLQTAGGRAGGRPQSAVAAAMHGREQSWEDFSPAQPPETAAAAAASRRRPSAGSVPPRPGLPPTAALQPAPRQQQHQQLHPAPLLAAPAAAMAAAGRLARQPGRAVARRASEGAEARGGPQGLGSRLVAAELRLSSSLGDHQRTSAAAAAAVAAENDDAGNVSGGCSSGGGGGDGGFEEEVASAAAGVVPLLPPAGERRATLSDAVASSGEGAVFIEMVSLRTHMLMPSACSSPATGRNGTGYGSRNQPRSPLLSSR